MGQELAAQAIHKDMQTLSIEWPVDVACASPKLFRGNHAIDRAHQTRNQQELSSRQTDRLSVVLFGLNAPAAEADISIQTRVSLIASDLTYCSRQRPTDALDCHIYTNRYPQIYLSPDYFRTDVQGNVLEQIIDAAKFYNAVDALAVSLASGNVVGGAVSAREAYNNFGDLMRDWGGKAVTAQDNFTVVYPTGIYDKVEIEFQADTDDDPLVEATSAPINNKIQGVSGRMDYNDRRQKRYTFFVDLSRFSLGRVVPVPLAFSVREGDCSLSCLRLAKVLNLIIVRAWTEPPVTATTGISFSRRDRSCDVCGFTTNAQLMSNSLTSGEKIQQTSLRIRQDSDGFYRYWSHDHWENYDQVAIGLSLNSLRPWTNNSPRIELQAACASGPCPSAIHTDVVPVFRSESKNSFYATMDPRSLPIGTYTLVFSANFEAGRGGTIALHTVRLTKEVMLPSPPKPSSLRDPRSNDGSTTAPRPKIVKKPN